MFERSKPHVMVLAADGAIPDAISEANFEEGKNRRRVAKATLQVETLRSLFHRPTSLRLGLTALLYVISSKHCCLASIIHRSLLLSQIMDQQP